MLLGALGWRLAAVDWPVRSARLSLHPAEPADAGQTWTYWRRPDVSRRITVAPVDVEQHRVWFTDPTHGGHGRRMAEHGLKLPVRAELR
ncbi:GNAT family N-acetyltransferase [Pseudonocardia charpentierae]|uniref:Uncharacterized protein n=1 Tax=Pseudonocardia charpentierae TaxID=3075545 RepID=A0ABU2NFZ0_9PSEU|nr:hypothetical protein [Pseudonocardia sp. DSM 45834]MDT0352666.1 hypothetical protein [Pseudonocardia sp. DSM 45834]